MATTSLLATFLKNCFSTIFGGHIEFLRKMQKRIYLGSVARWSDCVKILTHRVATFPENCFPAIFGGHLEFLRKHKNAYVSETILAEFLTCRVSA